MLEQAVLDRIDREKRSISWKRMLVIVLASAGLILGTTVFLAVVMAIPRVHSSTGIKVVLVVMPIQLVLFLLIIFGMDLYHVFRIQRPRFAKVIAPLAGKKEAVTDFEKGLQASSAAAGIDTPELTGLGIEGASTTLLQADGFKVAVSEGVLNAGLTREEAEGLMAHEVGHLALDEYFTKPPATSIAQLTAISWSVAALTLLLSLCFLALVIFDYETEMTNFYIVVLVYPFVPFGAAILAKELLRMFNLVDKHSDVLADSIACKLTGNPSALRSAIEKLSEAGLLNRLMGSSDFATKSVSSLLPEKKHSWRPKDSYLMVETTDENALAERVANLELIEAGEYAEFRGTEPAEEPAA